MKTFKVSGNISADEHKKLLTVAIETGVRSTAIVALGVRLALDKISEDPRIIKKLDRDGRRAVA